MAATRRQNFSGQLQRALRPPGQASVLRQNQQRMTVRRSGSLGNYGICKWAVQRENL